jgi:hypothetical protein
MIDPADIEALASEAEARRQNAHAQIETEFAETMAAILKIRSLIDRRNSDRSVALFDEASLPTEFSEPEPGHTSDNWPGLRQAIRISISARPKGFTLDDVMNDFKRFYPNKKITRVAVSGELWRMAKKSAITIQQKGAGRRPHLYVAGGKTNGSSRPEAEA